jgi:peptide/nickel transport system ATP-binding protein/oligopeptide transport system ATP-binding protein
VSLLEVSHLRVSFATEEGVVQAVDDVSFTVDQGEVVAIVGESGSGKSVTAMTLMGLTRSPNSRFEGSAKLNGQELITASDAELQRIRGGQIAMVFQDPMSSLDPVYRIGDQIAEQIRAHDKKVSKGQAVDKVVELLSRVGIPRAAERVRSYPHEFSGGMRQRVMIAMALSCSPSLLIADEPTTALDVTIQAQILDLMRDLSQEFGSSVILITHDMGVVAGMADRVAVMYAGYVVEMADSDEIFYNAKHPYTHMLLQSIPRLDQERGEPLKPIPGSPPDLLFLPPGCPFAPRCPNVLEKCRQVMPPLDPVDEPGHVAACWNPVGEAPR